MADQQGQEAPSQGSAPTVQPQQVPPDTPGHAVAAPAAAPAPTQPSSLARLPPSSSRQVRNIDQVVQLILECGNSLPDVSKKLLPALHALYTSEYLRGSEEFNKLLSDSSDPVAKLDMSNHTLGLLYILSVRIQHSQSQSQAPQTDALFRYLEQFAATYDVYQANIGKQVFPHFVQMIDTLGTNTNNTHASNRLILSLFHRYERCAEGYLTFFHAILAYNFLRDHLYQYAPEAFLDRDVWRTSAEISNLTYRDALTYFYYGGMIYAKLGRLERAEDFFETCVSLPAQSASVVQIDAYKKLVLVQLLKDGKTSPVPKFTSAPVNRQIRNQCQAYTLLAETYARTNSDHNTVEAAAVAHMAIFEADCNTGLVQQVLMLHAQRRIQRLADTYSTLALEELAKIVGLRNQSGQLDLQQAGDLVIEMVSKQWLNASLVPASTLPTTFSLASPSATSVVVFHDRAASPSNADTATIERVRSSMQKGKMWNDRLHHLERSIASSTSFLKKQSAQREAGRFAMGSMEDDYEEDML